MYPHTPHTTATRVMHLLSLHDALPISDGMAPQATAHRSTMQGTTAQSTTAPRTPRGTPPSPVARQGPEVRTRPRRLRIRRRSEEHTSELQSRGHLVCRLLLEKKN